MCIGELTRRCDRNDHLKDWAVSSHVVELGHVVKREHHKECPKIGNEFSDWARTQIVPKSFMRNLRIGLTNLGLPVSWTSTYGLVCFIILGTD